MLPIPLIPKNRLPASPHLRRASQTSASEASSRNAATIKRRLERRQNKERRQKKRHVFFERRQRAVLRRKKLGFKKTQAVSAALSDTVGKNIDTTA